MLLVYRQIYCFLPLLNTTAFQAFFSPLAGNIIDFHLIFSRFFYNIGEKYRSVINGTIQIKPNCLLRLNQSALLERKNRKKRRPT